MELHVDRLQTAREFYSEHEDERAERACIEVLDSAPQHIEALHLLGLIAYRRGDYQAAIETLNRAIRIDESQAAIHISLGMAHSALGMLAEAQSCFRRALEISPLHAEAHLYLGMSLLSTQDGARRVAVDISIGELIDKITILQIKAERIHAPEMLRNVRTELRLLTAALAVSIAPSESLRRLTAELKSINESLWAVEDEIRHCELCQEFGSRFIELARAVYRTNDRRAGLKRQINALMGSHLVEEKVYIQYEAHESTMSATERS